jgi:hypothetical protein
LAVVLLAMLGAPVVARAQEDQRADEYRLTLAPNHPIKDRVTGFGYLGYVNNLDKECVPLRRVAGARRDLLHQLWVARAVGGVSDLARWAGVSFATAHKELESTCAEGLATSGRVGRTLVYRASRKHPHSALLRRLLNEGAATGRTVPPARAEQVRGWLAALGAPLLVPIEQPARPTPEPRSALLRETPRAHGPGRRPKEHATRCEAMGLSRQHGNGELRLYPEQLDTVEARLRERGKR